MVIKRDSQNYISLDNLRTHSSTWSSDVHSPEEPTKPENVEPAQDEKLSSNRPWWATIVIQIFALAWIAPMLTLLVLNLKGYVIGPTAWCPSRHCYAETFAFNTLAHQEKLRKFNHNDHNLLGGK
ncbi:hypothetical protein M409DRAFT_15651 [Zasmidium cellare ATCC 36951]|uniref:Uncharacterized protein n=1 Tax=Zasmidium cellare ATCC 36951 TaxID=1080233 RepID=A0A6A6D6W0_ZASCE|nr:uncharacterized protein M409DRAFT_15651 [Zasmidium cellare ATCC 36951]KAF2173366.1 hypothetical protein M409DRAFT_15651 [Zasmidium cellare ATCC 36951]